MLIRFAVSCKAKSYGEVVQIAIGRTARVLSEICIIFNNAGVLIVYLIIMGDVMSGSVRHIGVLDQWIDSLNMTSAASVTVAVVFVVVCFAVAFIKLIEGKIEAPRRSLDFGSKMAILDLLVVIPIMTNAYVCHFNVQPIYNELEGDVLTNFDRNLGIRFSIVLNYICSSFGSGFPCYSLFPTANCG
ncbi:hypothetical protein PVK06_026636 [Gossypium arboreum]|uniref:Amino acid transporter transmembrane domain-containing protein n=1 Tax=Gossypium arboreum TaxID=29729 RepID=A0ABR0NY93_GOSAR|nr:hypothetical protein PVK06_026636 [Gossypium arboreum]